MELRIITETGMKKLEIKDWRNTKESKQLKYQDIDNDDLKTLKKEIKSIAKKRRGSKNKKENTITGELFYLSEKGFKWLGIIIRNKKFLLEIFEKYNHNQTKH